MLLSIQLELITTKMEKDRQYFEIKNNFKNSFYKKYINLCKKVKHNTLYLTNLSDKEEKKDVVEKLKDYIIKDFGFGKEEIIQMFDEKEKFEKISSKNIYNFLVFLKKIDFEEIKKDENIFQTISIFQSIDNRILSNMLFFLEKILGEQFEKIRHYIFNDYCAYGENDGDDYKYKYIKKDTNNITNLEQELENYENKEEIDETFSQNINSFKKTILEKYGENNKEEGLFLFKEGLNLLQKLLIENKDIIKGFIDSLKEYLIKNNKSKIYLNGRDGLKLKVLIEQYLPEIEIIWFEFSTPIHSKIKDYELKKYLKHNGINKDNIDGFIGVDTGSYGRILRKINLLFGKGEENNIFLWGTKLKINDDITRYEEAHTPIEHLPKENRRALDIIDGNLIQFKNNIQYKILSDFTDNILKNIL